MAAADPIEDQLDAAEREASRLFEMTSKAVGYEIQATRDIAYEVARRFEESLESDNARMCPHITRGPMPIFGSAALPGVIGCSNCLKILLKGRELQDAIRGDGRKCDGCGEFSEKGHVGLVNHGPLILQMSLCCPCAEKEDVQP